jgi:hypothetical protein
MVEVSCFWAELAPEELWTVWAPLALESTSWESVDAEPFLVVLPSIVEAPWSRGSLPQVVKASALCSQAVAADPFEPSSAA